MMDTCYSDLQKTLSPSDKSESELTRNGYGSGTLLSPFWTLSRLTLTDHRIGILLVVPHLVQDPASGERAILSALPPCLG